LDVTTCQQQLTIILGTHFEILKVKYEQRPSVNKVDLNNFVNMAPELLGWDNCRVKAVAYEAFLGKTSLNNQLSLAVIRSTIMPPGNTFLKEPFKVLISTTSGLFLLSSPFSYATILFLLFKQSFN
jgi:hypothetical protein